MAAVREQQKYPAMENEPGAECDPTALPPQQLSEEGLPEGDKRESTVPKAFKRKISVVSASKVGPVSSGDSDSSQPARKRRWGSSTVATQKKPSISITTESLKNLMPEMKPALGAVPSPGQEVVVELHPDDARISEEEGERADEKGSQDRGLKIRRTVTQVVTAEGPENGKDDDRDEEEEEEEEEEETQVKEPEVLPPVEPEVPPVVEVELKKVTPSETVVRRSISQQKTGMSVTIDDPVRPAQNPSPPRGKTSLIVHICNLVRPFTLGQLKELLNRTGTLVEEGFWIDKIKSHCYATYSCIEEAIATRNSLHGVKWPASNPKFLAVDYAEQDELDFHKGLKVERPLEPKAEEARGELRDHERAARELWAEREREMERRERTRSEREWDRDKVREYEAKEGGRARSRSRSRERRRKDRPKSKEKRSERKEKVPEEPPAKLLDDLFRKTKAAPCIYWLPLTVEQIVRKEMERADRAREREKRRKEQEEEERRREEERKERAKERAKEREKEAERGRESERKREHSRGRERRETKRHSRSRSTSRRDHSRR
ncbi:apoptotic chromatin condensation inducer 1b isoform X2 [Hypanus sabinus]|uniref:apoptotic chromatin condensation inducer 1b isoform X2 n=1 Tax=Hypanus sabinus TaxID=79690 RepID=UPI0028C436DC|nr:apoptotic chromatin condensation inducer 1b isoform X2 [Hypanus sabinus]